MRRKVALDFFAWRPLVWQAEASHLSPESDAAARRILDHMFVTCVLESGTPDLIDDDDYLRGIARVAEEQWPRVRKELIDSKKPIFVAKDGRISHARLTAEVDRALEISKKNSRNARAPRARGPAAEQAGVTDSDSHSPARTEPPQPPDGVAAKRAPDAPRAAVEPSSSDRSTVAMPSSDVRPSLAYQAHSADGAIAPQKEKETKNEIEIEHETTPHRERGIAGIELIREALAICAPTVVVTTAQLEEWLVEFGDRYWICAAIFDAGTSLRNARHAGYIGKTLQRYREERWQLQDASEYVEHVLRSQRGRVRDQPLTP